MSGPDLFSQPRRLGRGAALTLVFASVLVAGAATGSLPQGDEGTGAARSVVPDGRRQVAQAAAEAMAQGTSPLEAAERAVSRSGDRWAAVYSEGEYEEFAQALDGEYTGVGLWARRESDGRIAVSKVRGDSPAAAAGIRAGDRLRSVDGRAVDGLPVTDVLSLLRGDATDARAGTAVRVGLERGTRAWAETLRRATLSTQPVTAEKIRGGGTLVRVAAFTKGVGEAVRAAAREASGGVVLDLRGNSGGLVTEAVAVASVFLDGGLVATYDMDGAQRALHADAGGDTTRPLVVLVDGGTMSAAELLTGALQDRGRAVVVGTRTFGKGSVQMPTRLPDGSVAELTVGHYRTPSGHAVDGVGIVPDLEVADGVLGRAERVLSGLGRMP
ncbi:PDZ domain-containing protein [Streptomyces roseirectus]|uniref:PDZ domain-containing protein n=1 Tax=Streptomyces roseirectus TaxID=2768066 RepID=A0A7H0IHX9_9ACTN|nr:S41 family peptidase [Streptomyces roseirectus]QNP72395.1 PDZ domain-containing protein [Streptomyces roseirectus]